MHVQIIYSSDSDSQRQRLLFTSIFHPPFSIVIIIAESPSPYFFPTRAVQNSSLYLASTSRGKAKFRGIISTGTMYLVPCTTADHRDAIGSPRGLSRSHFARRSRLHLSNFPANPSHQQSIQSLLPHLSVLIAPNGAEQTNGEVAIELYGKTLLFNSWYRGRGVSLLCYWAPLS